jgi:ABC-type branched-chain amino acid transport systems, periplasmic component
MRIPVTRWVAILAAGLVLASMAGSAWSQAQPIPIGFAVAQTGNVALAGQEQVLGAQIAEDYFNKQGGVNGRHIKLIFQDAGSDEATAINAFQNLINVAKVVGIVGPSLSQQAFAADPIANRAKVPVIGPSNTAKGIAQIGEFVSRVSAPVAIVAPAAIKAALGINPKIRKVAVMYAQNDAFNKSETETFQSAVKDTFKLDLATVQTFQTTDTDFTAQVTNVLNVKPDLVIISGLQTDGANVVKQLRELGYKGSSSGATAQHHEHLPHLQSPLRWAAHRPGLQPGVQEQDQRHVPVHVQGQAEEGPAPVQRAVLHRRSRFSWRPCARSTRRRRSPASIWPPSGWT